jgi:hypothetical protein
LSNGAVIGWGALGLVAGLVAGTALGAWAGGVNRERVRRATRRLTVPAPAGPRTAAAAARDAQQSLDAEPALAGLGLEAVPAGPGAVELRGWVSSRILRARAARTVRGVAGIESVVNRILVRGEDDRPRPDAILPAGQPA